LLQSYKDCEKAVIGLGFMTCFKCGEVLNWGGADGWQESGRAEMAMRARTPGGAGGPLGGRSWSGCPLAWNLGGREGCNLGGVDG